ncbi:hypothetical protein JCM3766R1_002503 [Sporobolomyces carnicolor]
MHCLYISYPSLLSSYVRPSLEQDSEECDDGEPTSPQLILNPSKVPSTSLALEQLDQAQSRAVEQSSWILRCDSTATWRSTGGGQVASASGGISSLVAPDGSLRVIDTSGESWISHVDAALSDGRGTPFSRVWGKGELGSEFAVWLWIACAVVVAEICASIDREQAIRLVKKVWRWISSSEDRLINCEVQQGAISGDLI